MVQLDQRYNVDEALADPYFDITEGQNGQLRSDLAELECKSAQGQMWLTSYGQHNEDEERFGFCLMRQHYSGCK